MGLENPTDPTCDDCGAKIADREPPDAPVMVVRQALVPTGVRLKGTVQVPEDLQEEVEGAPFEKRVLCVECDAEERGQDMVEAHT